MKRTMTCLLLAALLLGASIAVAEAPAAGSLSAVQQSIRGNSSWTPESYPEIWITPVYASYIIEGKEKYPAHFLRFAPPEGVAPLRIDYDFTSMIDFDTLIQYSYQAIDRASYELFLEDVEAEDRLADGSDGIAAYAAPDSRRGYAMIDLKDYFGETSKLRIEIYDHTGDLSKEQRAQLVFDEAERVRAAVRFEELDHFWSQGAFASVELFDSHNKVSITVDTAGMTIVGLQDDKLKSLALADGAARSTELALSSYIWADEVEDQELADGTPYKLHAREYTSHAFFFIKEGEYASVYLEIKIETPPEGFAAELEKVYPLITLPEGE